MHLHTYFANAANLFQILLILLLFCNSVVRNVLAYEPTWESLDTRPLPQWYDNAKIGIVIHWGVYSVPSYESEWFWVNWMRGNSDYVKFMNSNYPSGFTYQEFAKYFKAELFDPVSWAELFQKSGVKYVILTSKHHEGYAMWPSTYSPDWNVNHVGPHRDLVGELSAAIRNYTNLKFGLYYSLYEWYNVDFLSDMEHSFSTNEFSANKVIPELMELVNKYHPDIIWTNGDWMAPDSYWNSVEFIRWLYNDSPIRDTVVVNDRWGSSNIMCHHGDFYTCSDNFYSAVLQPHKWEFALSLDKRSWGYRRNSNIKDYYTIHEVLVVLAQTVSCGGNLLLNVAPTSDGRILPIFQERLMELGEWLSVNGEAIYNSRPWIHQNEIDVNVWYTTRESLIYAIALEWPSHNELKLEKVVDLFDSKSTVVTLLGDSLELECVADNSSVKCLFPDKATIKGQWAWTLKIVVSTSSGVL